MSRGREAGMPNQERMGGGLMPAHGGAGLGGEAHPFPRSLLLREKRLGVLGNTRQVLALIPLAPSIPTVHLARPALQRGRRDGRVGLLPPLSSLGFPRRNSGFLFQKNPGVQPE